MDLKELLKEIKHTKHDIKEGIYPSGKHYLLGVKQTIEAINNSAFGCSSQTDTKLWWEIKELVSLSKPQASPSARSDNNDFKKDCLQCGGTGVMGNQDSNAECDSCLGTGKPILKS